MYKKQEDQVNIYSFITPFGGGLSEENRWVEYANKIPWAEFEKIYAEKFSRSGAPAKPLRLVLGAYILKNEYNFSYRAIIEEIRENPYLQYFIGLNEYSYTAPLSESLLYSFSKRFTALELDYIEQVLNEIKKDIKIG